MHILSFTPLATKRLILRNLKTEDRQALFLLRSDESVNRYLDRPKTSGLAQVDAFIEKIKNGVERGDSFYWVVTTKTSDELIGTVCLWNFSTVDGRAEIGYELMPAWQGKGLMLEAVKAILDFGFSKLRLQFILAFSGKGNHRSVALLQLSQFQRDLQYAFCTREESSELEVFYLPNPARPD